LSCHDTSILKSHDCAFQVDPAVRLPAADATLQTQFKVVVSDPLAEVGNLVWCNLCEALKIADGLQMRAEVDEAADARDSRLCAVGNAQDSKLTRERIQCLVKKTNLKICKIAHHFCANALIVLSTSILKSVK
jgi:hypothetical protein